MAPSSYVIVTASYGTKPLIARLEINISEIEMRKKTQTQLKAKIKELEDIQDMILGREMKMKTLRDEIAKLNRELKSRAAARD
jgi:predicted  nucleic acid-binding Zn-ribbon protein